MRDYFFGERFCLADCWALGFVWFESAKGAYGAAAIGTAVWLIARVIWGGSR